MTSDNQDGAVPEYTADELRSFIAQCLPFLKEAWESCFNGKEKALLSAEQRGMGYLLSRFQQIADGKPALPFGVITQKEASEQTESALLWAHRLLGSPNELREELRDYIGLGETCAHGIIKAHKEIVGLRNKAEQLERRCRELEEVCRKLQIVGNRLDLKHPHSHAMAHAKWELIRDELAALLTDAAGEKS